MCFVKRSIRNDYEAEVRNDKFVLNVAIGTYDVISFEIILAQVNYVGELTETAPLLFDRL